MIKLGIKGHFKIEKECSITGKRERVADFDNLITNGGLDRIGNANNTTFLYNCQVGTGTTPPSFSDSALTSFFATTGKYGSPNFTTTNNPLTGEIKTEIYFRFNAGVFNSTVLGEIGISWNTVGGGSLFSKALIVDELGNPTTITVLSTEYLYVTYTLSLFAPVEDFSGSFIVGSTTYNYTGRVSSFGNSWGSFVSGVIQWSGLNLTGYSGSMGAITGSPSGTSYSLLGGGSTLATYNNGDYRRDYSGTCVIGVVRSIKSVRVVFASNMAFQFELDNPIETTALQTLTLNTRISWARV